MAKHRAHYDTRPMNEGHAETLLQSLQRVPCGFQHRQAQHIFRDRSHHMFMVAKHTLLRICVHGLVALDQKSWYSLHYLSWTPESGIRIKYLFQHVFF